jgi:hypothetical protein
VRYADEVTVRVTTVVASCSVLEGSGESVPGTVVPMGWALSMVVPGVSVSVGRDMRVVLAQPRVLETSLGEVGTVRGVVAVPKPVELATPCEHGAFCVEVALTQGPWPLELLIGRPDTLDMPESEE